MKKLIVMLAISLISSGCTSVDQIHMPNGQMGFAVDCSGKMNTWNSCYKKLAEQCGSRGYELITRDAEQGMSGGSYGSSSFGSSSYGSAFGTNYTRTLMGQCK